MPRPIVTLLTDFGVADHYVGAVKAVLLRYAPEVQIVDITHEIPPQDVARGAYELAAAVDYFPKDTVHLAVVDPGVGTDRRPIVVRSPRAKFVGPDNGLFSRVLMQAGATIANGEIVPPADWRAREIAVDRFRLEPFSATFHGRDLFGPVAGRLAAGMPFREVGERITGLVSLAQPPYPSYVLSIDRFGNIITNRQFDSDASLRVTIGDRVITQLTRTYGDGTGLIALIGSSGYLEIALPGGSAAAFLGIAVGDPVDVAIGSSSPGTTQGNADD